MANVRLKTPWKASLQRTKYGRENLDFDQLKCSYLHFTVSSHMLTSFGARAFREKQYYPEKILWPYTKHPRR